MEEYDTDTICDEEIIGEGIGRIDAAMERELHGRQSLCALFAMIAGGALLAAYLVLSLLPSVRIPDDLAFLLFLFGVLSFAVGLLYTVTYARLRRMAASAAENRYRFGRTRFYVISRTSAGELIGKARYRYEAITRCAQSEHYLFLTVKTEAQNGIFPILRESLGEDAARFLAERIAAAHPEAKTKKQDKK